jgi:bifunctional enzyme CysN/CysC
MVDAGLIVLVSFISPFRSERRMAGELFTPAEFFKVFVDAPAGRGRTARRQGLYKKAQRGELMNITGIDSPYEPPESPKDLHRYHDHEPQQAADHVVAQLSRLDRGTF